MPESIDSPPIIEQESLDAWESIFRESSTFISWIQADSDNGEITIGATIKLSEFIRLLATQINHDAGKHVCPCCGYPNGTGDATPMLQHLGHGGSING